jgi:hypothetical protein
MAKHKKGMGEMGDLSGLGDLAGYAEDAMDLGILGGTATIGLLGANAAVANIPWVKDQRPAIQGGISIGLGLLTGILVGRFVHRGAGAGLGAGMLASGLAKVAKDFLPASFTAKVGLAALVARSPQEYRVLAEIKSRTPADLRTLSGFRGVNPGNQAAAAAGGAY